MQHASLQKYSPRFEGVLGPLSEQDDYTIREIFRSIDETLLELARHFEREEAGWEGTGLELSWYPSGETSIGSYVSTSKVEDGTCVDFGIEIRPSWCSGERSSRLLWDVELNINADCGHAVYCGHMHNVHESVVRVGSPISAVETLRNAVHELQRLATEFPLEHWLELAAIDDE